MDSVLDNVLPLLFVAGLIVGILDGNSAAQSTDQVLVQIVDDINQTVPQRRLS
jgi:hypothetical protein